jgi:hypothetical protein
MYERQASKGELEAFGFRPEDYAHECVEIWPENALAVDVFRYLQTQWRVGAAGATGFDYNIMHHKLDRMRLGAEEYEQVTDDIRFMEFEVLSVMNEKPE